MGDTSIGTLLTGLIQDLGQLVRQELRLAQSEASEKFKQAQNGVYAVLTGLLVAFCALLILLQALVIALSNVLPAWLAAVVVGVALSVVAFVLIHQGRSNLKARNLIPERTLRSARSKPKT
ncbi:MAG: phage holin family protein [Kiloniellaceae bacterium]